MADVVPFRRARRRRPGWTVAWRSKGVIRSARSDRRGRFERRRRGRRAGVPSGWPLLLLVCVAAGLWLYSRSLSVVSGPAPAPGEFWTVESDGRAGGFRHCGWGAQSNCVIDGDTIRHRGVKVRLADIDAPETWKPQCASERALGQKATRRLVELMNDGPIDIASSGSRDEDAYGRKLRIVSHDGRSLGDVLIAEGLARRWDGVRRSWCD